MLTKNVTNIIMYMTTKEVVEMSDEKQKIVRKLKKAIPDMDDAEKIV